MLAVTNSSLQNPSTTRCKTMDIFISNTYFDKQFLSVIPSTFAIWQKVVKKVTSKAGCEVSTVAGEWVQFNRIPHECFRILKHVKIKLGLQVKKTRLIVSFFFFWCAISSGILVGRKHKVYAMSPWKLCGILIRVAYLRFELSHITWTNSWWVIE